MVAQEVVSLLAEVAAVRRSLVVTRGRPTATMSRAFTIQLKVAKVHQPFSPVTTVHAITSILEAPLALCVSLVSPTTMFHAIDNH